MLMSSSEVGVSFLASCPQAPPFPLALASDPQGADGHVLPPGAWPLGGRGCGLPLWAPQGWAPSRLLPHGSLILRGCSGRGHLCIFLLTLRLSATQRRPTRRQKTGTKARPAGRRPPCHCAPSSLQPWKASLDGDRPAHPVPRGLPPSPAGCFWPVQLGGGSGGGPIRGAGHRLPEVPPAWQRGSPGGAQESFRWGLGSHML